MPRESNDFLSREEYGKFRASFHDDEDNYTLLRSDTQGVRERSGVWDTDFVLEKYVKSTDRLIGMMDGSIHSRNILDPDNPEVSAQKPDTVIFLDKSARPVSWFTDALWEQFAQEGAEKPHSEFMNIDRVNWFVKQGHDPMEAETQLGREHFDIDKVPKKEIARIRALYVNGTLDRDNWEEEVWKMPTSFDGKNILIVDEVPNKGGTLFIATELMKKAFPEATFSGEYFWESPQYAVGGDATQLKRESVPVWYSREDVMGRGVGEVSIGYYEHRDDIEQTDESFKKRIGALALSAPHFDPDTLEEYPAEYDKKALKLKQDIAYLSYGVGDKKILRVPDRERFEEDAAAYVAIIKEQGFTPHKFNQYRQSRAFENDSQKKNPRPKNSHGKAA